MVTRLSGLFAAGCLGGLATVLTLWLFGMLGISAALGVALAPPLTPPMIYSFMIWGGIWGFAFLLPLGSVLHWKKSEKRGQIDFKLINLAPSDHWKDLVSARVNGSSVI